MRDFYIDFDSITIQAETWEEALAKAKKVVEELQESKDTTNWTLVDSEE